MLFMNDKVWWFPPFKQSCHILYGICPLWTVALYNRKLLWSVYSQYALLIALSNLRYINFPVHFMNKSDYQAR